MSSFEHLRKARNQQSPLLTHSTRNEVAAPTLSTPILQRAHSLPNGLRPADVPMLQSSIGNIAVGNLLARNQSRGAQPGQSGIVQRTPLSNTIQRNTDDDVSEDSIDNNIAEVFAEETDSGTESDTDDDFEDEIVDEMEPEEDPPAPWSTSSYMNRQYGIPTTVPDYQSSPTAVHKKMGFRRRLMNRVAHRGALALDRAKNKATGGSSFSLTARAEAREKRQYNKADGKLMWKHYASQLPRKERRQLRKKLRQENRAYAQEMQQDKHEERKLKQREEDVKWISKHYFGGGAPAVNF